MPVIDTKIFRYSIFFPACCHGIITLGRGTGDMSARSSHATSDSKSPSPFPMESLEQMENDELMNYVEEME